MQLKQLKERNLGLASDSRCGSVINSTSHSVIQQATLSFQMSPSHSVSTDADFQLAGSP